MTSSFLLLARYIQLLEVEQQVVGVQEHLVGRGRDRVGDLPCSFNLPQGKEGRVVCDGLTNQLRTLSLSLYKHRPEANSASEQGSAQHNYTNKDTTI